MGPRSDSRRDAIALKQQLADALGDNGPQYWKALTEFVTGKLNRQEFDFYANLYIPAHHVHLHNAFILATIHNAHREDTPPEDRKSVEWSRKRRYDEAHGYSAADGSGINSLLDDDGPFDVAQQQRARRQKLKKLLQSMSKADRRMIRQLLKKAPDTPTRPDDLVRHGSQRPVLPIDMQRIPPAAVADYARGVQAPLCSDTKSIPDIESLRDRLLAITLEHGLLDGVSSECIDIMLYALDNHLRDIVFNCISKVRANRPVGPQYTPASTSPTTSPSSAVSGSSLTTLRLSDLLFSLEIAPHVLTEMPISIERLSSSIVYPSDSEDDLPEASSNGKKVAGKTGSEGHPRPGFPVSEQSPDKLRARSQSFYTNSPSALTRRSNSAQSPPVPKAPRLSLQTSPATGKYPLLGPASMS
ncbi:hypothetical protein H4R34_000901 [Dimargaris verticillata]|uniref:Transcriptional regulator of RNA polII, SAGA, subunit-domain-containing protein n=1 Tax=Dimargaris verticillata TaxID=2761393 RepID=A0A9W8BBR3_9FUNG|nr:hypothetical protein H4R34_000901 [Dimargaris verticillata]